jgi:hypothetical protein
VVAIVGDGTVLVIPPADATADAVAAALELLVTLGVVGDATADSVASTVGVGLSAPPGLSTGDAVSGSLGIVLSSPPGVATADAVAATFYQQLIETLSVIITQAASLGSTIQQRVLAPVITAARSLGTSVFRD